MARSSPGCIAIAAPCNGLRSVGSHRKRYSAGDIMCKFHRADELTGAAKTGEEIGAELEVSPATLYNCRRIYGGMRRSQGTKEPRE